MHMHAPLTYWWGSWNVEFVKDGCMLLGKAAAARMPCTKSERGRRRQHAHHTTSISIIACLRRQPSARGTEPLACRSGVMAGRWGKENILKVTCGLLPLQQRVQQLSYRLILPYHGRKLVVRIDADLHAAPLPPPPLLPPPSLLCGRRLPFPPSCHAAQAHVALRATAGAWGRHWRAGPWWLACVQVPLHRGGRGPAAARLQCPVTHLRLGSWRAAVSGMSCRWWVP